MGDTSNESEAFQISPRLTKDLLRGVSAAAALSGWCKHWSPKTKAHLKLGEFGGHRWSWYLVDLESALT